MGFLFPNMYGGQSVTTSVSTLKNPDIQQEMISELAKGIENPYDVADRFGISRGELDELSKWEPFKKAVEAKRAEFASSGLTTRLDAQLKYEALSNQLFRMALTNDSTFNQKLSALEHFAHMADIKPKPNQAVQTGTGFSITINLTPSQPQEKVIEAKDISIQDGEIVETNGNA